MPLLLSAVLLATAPALRVWGGGGEGGMLKPPDVMLCRQELEKAGLLNKTKIAEGGRKLR